MQCRQFTIALTLLTLLQLPLADSQAQEQASAPLDPAAMARKIQDEVATIRGLPFKRTVEAKSQTAEEFREYLDERIQTTVPESMKTHYGKVVRKLGLYRGPEIEDAPALMKSVTASQAAAYYDPQSSTFYVLTPNLSELAMGVLFSHELYHGLQDQYFDLETYMRMNERDVQDNDVQLARQSVVEGEATYMMSMWMLQRMTGQAPTRQMMEPVVRMQSAMDMSMVAATLKQPQVAELLGSDMQAAMEAAKEIPPFILDMMMGAYMKGLGFVFDVQAHGWKEVEKLYSEYPPVSTEQILHPDKWFAREAPQTIAWRALDRERALKEWDVIAQNTVGEFLWRTIFREHGLAQEAQQLAAGWDGDRYVVLQQKDSKNLLLLLNTAWDTEQDAIEFAAAYERLLKVKYENATHLTLVERKGKDVFIVEGSDERSLKTLMKITKSAKRRRA
jgi:hypothetical protein